jgi:hypothetical protein
MRPALALSCSFGLAAALLAAGCTDPIHDGAVKEMGKDTRAPNTEFHRAGEPCGVCHQTAGPASTVFTVAGTVFSQPDSVVGIDGVEIDMTDSASSMFHTKTNCVGNFYVKDSDWSPYFPILVRITKNGITQSMVSTIGRETSCAACHFTQVTDPLSQVNHVYLGAEDPSPPGMCGANPDLSQGP